VFGPLPQLHRQLVLIVALVVGVASGIWVADSASLPSAVAAGAGWGALAGLLLGYVLLHDFHRPRAVRVRRH
jgi:hypothetical protein